MCKKSSWAKCNLLHTKFRYFQARKSDNIFSMGLFVCLQLEIKIPPETWNTVIEQFLMLILIHYADADADCDS